MAADRTNPFLAKTSGKPDTKSRAKAQQAHDRAKAHLPNEDEIPRGVSGQPMMKISMTASELIPTGQYANVSVGPAQITAWIDPARALDDNPYFSEAERATIAQALNELAEIVEGDVVAVQRNIVMESLQDQVSPGS